MTQSHHRCFVIAIFLIASRAEAIDAPVELVAAITAPGRVDLGWNAVIGAEHYEVERGVTTSAWAPIGTSTINSFSDSSASGTVYVYRVRAVDGSANLSGYSNVAASTTSAFDDDPLIAALTTPKPAHVTQLRTAVDAMRSAAGMSAASYGESIVAGGTVKAAHLLELRDALNPARAALGFSSMAYQNALVAHTTPIRAADVAELRDGVRRRAVSPTGVFWNATSSGASGVQALVGGGATVFAGTSASGVFRSIDNGATWSASNSGLTNLNVAAFAIATTGPLFAGTVGGGVFRSNDAGVSWTAAGNAPANVTTLLATSGGIFAAGAVPSCSGIFLSTDIGATWNARNSGLGNLCVTSLAAASNGHLFAGTPSGVFRSTDNSASWSGASSGITSTNVRALAASGTRVFAATQSGGVFRSTDDGATWSPVISGLGASNVASLLTDNNGDLFAGSEATAASIARSSNNGDAWIAASSGLPPSNKVNAFATTSRYRFAAVDGRVYRAPGGFRLNGLDFGPWKDGQDPSMTIGEAQLVERMTIIRPFTKWIRTYGMTNGLQMAGRIAHALGMSAALGASIGADANANQTQLANLIAAGRAAEGDILIAANEELGVLPDATIIAYVNQIRQALPAMPVGISDRFDRLLAHPSVIAVCNVVLANDYPFWEPGGVSIDHALEHLQIEHQQIVAQANGARIIIAESGWPTAGSANGASVPSLANANAYFLNFVSWAEANHIEYFFFEAFDENWKVEPGDVGKHWGIWNADGTLKGGMDATLAGDGINPLPGGPGAASIDFTSVPPRNTIGELRGLVQHVRPTDYRVAVFIYNGAWYTKPTYDQPLTAILADGTFVCNITTNTMYDPSATQIAAFVIPTSYTPPILMGTASLPGELYTNAVAQLLVMR